MALPFLSPARTVLLIGDEALSIYNVSFKAAKLVETVAWQADDFDERVVRLIRVDCGGKPALLVNDMTDQHFKGGQRLPKVSVLDKTKVLERKLQAAFPNYPIRGALPIKSKNRKAPVETARGPDGKPVAASGSGSFLFAAVPMSEPITKTMEVVRQSMVSIAGLVLLPIEAADMVASLSSKLSGKETQASRWCIFIGQHRGGALRQVITRDGQLAMTRMTPVAESEDQAQWAGDVAQEIKATVSYLSRFGYSPNDGTDVIVICTPDGGEALKETIDIQCNYTALTANEAARLLGMGIGIQEDQRYAEPLHSAWIGRKNAFALPMQAQALSNVLRPRQYAAVAMFLLVLGAGYLAWQCMEQVQSMMEIRNDLSDQTRSLGQATAEQETEVQRMAALGFDVKLIKAAIGTYETLKKGNMDPLSAIKKIGAALGNELRLSTLKVEMVDAMATQDANNPMAYTPEGVPVQGGAPKDMLATLVLNFPSTIEPGVGVNEVNGLQARLQSAFPGYKVSVTRQVAGMDYTANTSGQVGVVDATAKTMQDYVAELQIRGHSQ